MIIEADNLTNISDSDMALIRKSYQHYASLNLKIENKDGDIIPFTFNRMQRRLYQLFVEDFNSRKPIRWLIIKARQLGCTTWIAGMIYWLITMNYNRRALVLSYDEDSAQEILQKYQSFYLRSIIELQPKVRRMNRDLVHFATPLKDISSVKSIGLNSKLFANTAEAQALGHSYTFHYVHASEYAIWDSVGIDVDSKMAGLNEAVPKRPNTLIIKETTAKGHNIAYQEWYDDFLPDRKIFISWIADEDYRKELNYFTYPELSKLIDSRYGDEYQEREDIIKELKFWYPEESINPVWLEHEAQCRLAWRREKIDELKGNKFEFMRSYPTTPEKAFNNSTTSIFEGERLADIQSYIEVNKIKPYTFSYSHDDSIDDYKYKFYQSSYGSLRVYELPKENTNYVIGADGAQGIKNIVTDKKEGFKEIRGDDSSCVVLSLPFLTEVASFNDIISPTEFSGLLNYLGKFYNNALLGVERNDKGGYATIELLANTYYYPNLYYHIDPMLQKVQTNIQYGFKTGEHTRDLMIRDLITVVDNNLIIIRSKQILDQMKTFVKTKTGKIMAMPGKHDDLMIALGIAIQMSRQVHIPRDVNRKPNKPPKYSLDWWASQQSNNLNYQRIGRR